MARHPGGASLTGAAVRTPAALISRLARSAAGEAGLSPADLTGAPAVCCLAGGDLPWQVAALRAAIGPHEFALSVIDAPPVAGAALLGFDHLRVAASRDAVCRAFRDGTPRAPGIPRPPGVGEPAR